MRSFLLPLLLCASALTAQAALADEAISIGDKGSPPLAEAPREVAQADNSPQAIGDWARGVMAGDRAAPDGRSQKASACPAPADRKPHGQVWAGVGTGGDRDVGGVVTQPIGDCGELTVGFDHSEGGGYYGRRR